MDPNVSRSSLADAMLDPKSGPTRPGPLTWIAVWLARCFVVACIVVLPALMAHTTWVHKHQWPWLRYVMPPLFVICALVGCVYTWWRWADPPIWAWILSRTLAYREDWKRR